MERLRAGKETWKVSFDIMALNIRQKEAEKVASTTKKKIERMKEDLEIEFALVVCHISKYHFYRLSIFRSLHCFLASIPRSRRETTKSTGGNLL